MKNYPQVLLLGNGINISNGSETWKKFIESLAEDNGLKWTVNNTMPMPLQAILISNNKLKQKLEKKAKGLLPSNPLQDKTISLSSLLSIDFDEILTTNYTYELEQACFEGQTISISKLRDMHVNINGEKAEPKYLLETCNKAYFEDKEQRIWHIHGEARKPSSMVLGHYYYGNLVNRIINYIKAKKNSYSWCQNNEDTITIKSWIDAFILGDVYVLGQALDPSEIDLWWLLNRKYNEKAKHGKIYFFEPFKESQQEKIALLKCFGVEVENCGIKEEIVDKKDCTNYILFYNKAIEKIKKIQQEEEK